jgi:hypothetical protein
MSINERIARIEKVIAAKCNKKLDKMGAFPKHTLDNERILQEVQKLLDSVPARTARAYLNNYKRKSM